MQQEVYDLYDQYAHYGLDRRELLQKLAVIAGGFIAAETLLKLLESNQARAQTIAPEDSRITTSRVSIPGPKGELKAYLALPKGDAKTGAVLVVHENRGLNAHIEDVARRVAAEGMIGLAVDFLSGMGGTPMDPDQARDMFGKLDMAAVVADAKAALAWLATQPTSNGKTGIVGFCWGGGLVNLVAEADPDLDAAVAFYGRTPPLDRVPAIKAPLLLNYAGNDAGINAGVPDYEKALKAAGKSYEIYTYEGVQHAFHNDTSEARYDAAAAKLAWGRTIAFFKKNLS